MSDTTNRLSGIASVTANGITITLIGKLKYQPSGVKRESLTGMDGPHGYKETPVIGHIVCDVRDSGGTSVKDFNDMTNVTVSAQLANGKTIIGTNMWTVDTQEVDTEEASFTVKWEGFSVSEN